MTVQLLSLSSLLLATHLFLFAPTATAVRLAAHPNRPSAVPSSRQYTSDDFVTCKQSPDCATDLSCYNILNGEQCSGASQCRCVPDAFPFSSFCSKQFLCSHDGHVCAQLSSNVGLGLCVNCTTFAQMEDQVESDTVVGGDACKSTGNSTTQSDDASESDSGWFTFFCVDAKLLAHIDPKHLVFPTHRRAPTLCDQHGSCATHGHIVLHNQRPMTMHTYCLQPSVSCTRRIVAVNSPRMTLGRQQQHASSLSTAVRIDTHTPGLSFTALAARYGSRVEEFVLTSLVRLGL